jgi:hypothetical protein
MDVGAGSGLIQQCSTQQHWVEVELIGRDNVPIAYEKYSIQGCDQEISSGRLDKDGWIRIEGITDADSCQITFPNLDQAVWDFIESVAARGAPGPTVGRARTSKWLPDAGSSVTVQTGQCCTSIATSEGHYWQTIWNASQNDDLRDSRPDPNCLRPGDDLYIPALTAKQPEEERAVDRRHRYRYKQGAKLVLQLKYPNGDVRANAPYSLTVDDLSFNGNTDPNGQVNVAIPPTAEKGTLIINADGGFPQQTYKFELGTLWPHYITQGVQQRLQNMGARGFNIDNQTNDETTAVINGFQLSSGSGVTGDPTDISTPLKNLHGS